MDENEVSKLIWSKGIDISTKMKGQKLFHYTDVYALMSIIDKGKLWITKSDYLNDSSELIHIHEIVDNVIPNLTIKDKDFLEILKDYKDDIESMMIDIFVLSLSENPDSLTLWSNYSQSDGYCIGFEAIELAYAIKNLNMPFWFGQVNYDKEIQAKIIQDEIEFLYSLWSKEKDNLSLNKVWKKLIQKLSLYSIFFKNPAFSQEEETRIAFMVNRPSFKTLRMNTDQIKMNFRVKNAAIVPYIEIDLKTANNGRLPITSLTIGPKNNLDIAVSGLNLFLLNHGYSNCIVDKSKIPVRY